MPVLPTMLYSTSSWWQSLNYSTQEVFIASHLQIDMIGSELTSICIGVFPGLQIRALFGEKILFILDKMYVLALHKNHLGEGILLKSRHRMLPLKKRKMFPELLTLLWRSGSHYYMFYIVVVFKYELCIVICKDYWDSGILLVFKACFILSWLKLLLSLGIKM